jgi:FixJ family two-component response regulator
MVTPQARVGKICILDDDPSILRSLKELLSSDDFEAEVFDDPEKFLEYVRAHAVRLAILDVWMPTQSGIDMQKRLHHSSPETRVIIITGREEPAIRTLGLDGAFAFFSKPVDSETFLASVRAALTE